MQKLIRFFNKNIVIFNIFMFEILTKPLTNNVVSFEQPGPGVFIVLRNVNC